MESKNERTQDFLNLITHIDYQKVVCYYVHITLYIDDNFQLSTVALVDSGADMTCIREGLIPRLYFENTSESLVTISRSALNIQYTLSKAHICNKGINISFILVKNLNQAVILGTPFCP